MSKKFLMLVAVAVLGVAGSKEKIWQSATLLDANYNQYFAHVSDFVQGGSVAYVESKDVVSNLYVVETDSVVYRVEHTRAKTAPEPRVKRYVKLRVAVEKDHLWIEDSEGKSVWMRIIEKKPRSL